MMKKTPTGWNLFPLYVVGVTVWEVINNSFINECDSQENYRRSHLHLEHIALGIS